VTPQGAVRVQTAAHDIGTGAYTAIAQTAAGKLGVALDRVTVELGDSTLPPAPVAGGSNTTASMCNVVANACEQIRERIAAAAVRANDGPLAGNDAAELKLADGTVRGPNGAWEPLQSALRRVGPAREPARSARARRMSHPQSARRFGSTRDSRVPNLFTARVLHAYGMGGATGPADPPSNRAALSPESARMPRGR